MWVWAACRKTTLAAMLTDGLLRRLSRAPESRRAGGLRPFQAAQQSLDGGFVPFAVPRRWYLSLIQLTCNGSAGDNARSPKFTNCWSQGPGSHLCCPLVRQSIIDPSVCNQAQARKDPRDGGGMPLAAKPRRSLPSVQLVRQRRLGYEPSRHKLPEGRSQSAGAGVRSPLDGQRTEYPFLPGRRWPACRLHLT